MNVSCPFNYTGGKFKLLEQIQPLFSEGDVFLDLFSGGGNVGINSSSKTVYFNDINENLIYLIKYIRDTEKNILFEKIDDIIAKYDLSNASLNGYSFYNCDSSKGLGKYNKNKFLKLRKDFNSNILNGEIDYAQLYVLIVYSFNNQIRFNKKGEFNLPVGKRDFNSRMRKKLELFSEKIKNKDVHFLTKNFRNISLEKFPSKTFIYCDPPYLVTDATYNENGMWAESDEKDLLAFLDNASEQGFKFALSNVLESKNRRNHILDKWIETRGYNCHYLSKSYSNSNYHRKNKQSVSVEVLVTNYVTDRTDVNDKK